MSALTAARKSLQMGTPDLVLSASLDIPIKANAKPFVGGVVATDSTGYGVAGSAATGLIVSGIARSKAGYPQQYDATGLASGALVAPVQQGIFAMHVGSAGDALAQADFLAPVFLIDDNTVGKTDGGATPRSIAGIFMGFAPNGTDAFVLMSSQLNALILASRQVTEAGLSIESISTAGAISVATDVTLLTIAGTVVYTLANGTKIGQRKIITCISATATPVGSIVVATPRGFATLTAIGAIGPVCVLRWTATGWIFESAKVGTIA
jgi:hypothetical protein